MVKVGVRAVVGVGDFARTRGVPLAHEADLAPHPLTGGAPPQVIGVGFVHCHEKVEALKVDRQDSPCPVGDFESVAPCARARPRIGGFTGVVAGGSCGVDNNTGESLLKDDIGKNNFGYGGTANIAKTDKEDFHGHKRNNLKTRPGQGPSPSARPALVVRRRQINEGTAKPWRDVPSFSAKDHAPQDLYENLRGHFTDKEIVDLTVTIARGEDPEFR